mmetsp:Transcript_12973/g.20385  ORF Transcript_12973/g.20385 Transcript_12973/m.20385 type:complete len:254 (-) Transcript_12973:381-1142(-)
MIVMSARLMMTMMVLRSTSIAVTRTLWFRLWLPSLDRLLSFIVAFLFSIFFFLFFFFLLSSIRILRLHHTLSVIHVKGFRFVPRPKFQSPYRRRFGQFGTNFGNRCRYVHQPRWQIQRLDLKDRRVQLISFAMQSFVIVRCMSFEATSAIQQVLVKGCLDAGHAGSCRRSRCTTATHLPFNFRQHALFVFEELNELMRFLSNLGGFLAIQEQLLDFLVGKIVNVTNETAMGLFGPRNGLFGFANSNRRCLCFW